MHGDDPEEKLMREMLLESYREIVPEVSVRGDALCRKLAAKLVAKGGRILLGPPPARRYVNIHHSLDKDGRILWTCKDWCEVLGYPRRSGLGRKFTDLLAPTSSRFFEEVAWPSLLREGRGGPVVLHLLTHAGVWLTASWKSEIMRDSLGAFHRTFARLRVSLALLACLVV